MMVKRSRHGRVSIVSQGHQGKDGNPDRNFAKKFRGFADGQTKGPKLKEKKRKGNDALERVLRLTMAS